MDHDPCDVAKESKGKRKDDSPYLRIKNNFRSPSTRSNVYENSVNGWQLSIFIYLLYVFTPKFIKFSNRNTIYREKYLFIAASFNERLSFTVGFINPLLFGYILQH